MKTLVVYYSYSGNTKSVAKYLANKINAKAVEITTKVAYSSDYDKVVEDAKSEIRNGFTPEINSLDVNINDFDTIILGTPVWWYTFAPAVRSFLTKYNLEGKRILPFATNGGWLGHTFKDIEKLCPNSELLVGLDIPFDGNKQRLSNEKIDKWLKQL